nr:MAG TPA: hypothetical protein [Caudoviricetes sp.]
MWIADGIVQTHHSTHIYIQKLGKRRKSDITNPKKVKNVINEEQRKELNPERMQKCVGNIMQEIGKRFLMRRKANAMKNCGF